MDASGGWRRFGQVFDGVAEAYDEIRPGYPPELVDAALERGGLHAGARVVEVGCGTGKLTELLAARGLSVDAVDPGPNMIETARRRVGPDADVRFHVAQFEDVALPEAAFAALLSATAFHWVDPAVAWRKAASHLEPGGLLALLTHRGHSAELDEAFRALVGKHAPDVAEAMPPDRDLQTILAGIEQRRGNASEVWDWVTGGHHGLAVAEAAGLFADTEVASIVTDVAMTADELTAQLRTTSLYFRVDPSRRQAFADDHRRLVERLGGTAHFAQASVLMTALRV